MSASIITVGTEITDGQITDSNSQWIAKKLDALDIRTTLHISVPDNRELMMAAFEFAALTTELVFICGGLGPTIDDFTRDVVAEFLAQPLVTDSNSLRIIEQKLNERKLTIRDGHRRQALLPKTAQALENSYGVAPGFFVESESHHGKNQFWVLPGPPKEIAAIWNDHIQKKLELIPKTQNALKLHTWLCLGVPESEVAQITEDYFNAFGFEKQFGYRIQLPYVEVKLWCDPNAPDVEKALREFPNKLGDNYVGKSSAEIYQPFLNFVGGFSKLQLTDNFSDGLFLTRLQQILPSDLQEKINLTYTLGSNKVIPRSAVPKDTLLIEVQKPMDQELIWHLKTMDQEKQIRVPLISRRSSHFTKLYAFEILVLKASSSTSITSS
jgi:molybdenum cofactor synthesis domain-containing protein